MTGQNSSEKTTQRLLMRRTFYINVIIPVKTFQIPNRTRKDGRSAESKQHARTQLEVCELGEGLQRKNKKQGAC